MSKISALTGKPIPEFYIHSDSNQFKDTSGRTLILRGVNLSGSAKIPKGHPHHVLKNFWESAEQDGQLNSNQSNQNFLDSSLSSSSSSSSSFNLNSNHSNNGISYIGQNLNLQDGSADLHLTRLRQWGFNCIRFVTVWEALEHQGPGQYDLDYMDYVVEILRKCKKFGFRVYMDPHQDLFSRFCGGSGAPLWTLYACGLNPRNFTVTGAAYLQAEWPHPHHPDPDSFPAMIWTTNYERLACQTVNTFFWAGRDFAPNCIIDGINIQDYLQYHFLEAYRHLAIKLAQAGDLLDHTVIGWDSINEPNHGYIGTHTILSIPDDVPLKIGPSPTPIQGMKLAMGQAFKVENYRFGPVGPQRDGNVLIDPQGRRAWLHQSAEPGGLSGYGWRRDPGWLLGTCIWAQHGVWDPSTGVALKPDYFAFSPNDPTKKADFAADYWRPHLNAYCHMIRSIHPEAILFVHPPVFKIPPNLKSDVLPILQNRSVFSSHFYDGLTLITKHWNWFNADALGIIRGKYPSLVFGLKVGETAIRKCMRSQLAMLKQDGVEKMGEFPTMMGEIGIPYDLDKRRAYKDGDYGNQIRALDASLNACDGENMLNYTIWNYCPSNSHSWGDLWNGEDLSIWSLDDATYQGSSYLEKSNRLGKILGRPFQYNYGAQSSGPTPNASAMSLTNRRPGGFDDTCESLEALAYHNSTLSGLNLVNLNDGARALAAFCRPFPVATVGTPVYFNFDISTASFELIVQVSDQGADDIDWGNEQLPTEIYVPATHFGSVSESSTLRPRSLSEADLLTQNQWLDDPSGSSLTLDVNSSNDELRPSASRVSLPSFKNVLQLDVTVSIGRWETEGQILRWYYPKKPIDGKPVGRYTLKVKRKAGPIVWDGEHRLWRRIFIRVFEILSWFMFWKPTSSNLSPSKPLTPSQVNFQQIKN
ncbi:hypothetical protein O181_061938 [Austropuccinia psidii MF-1]|uniref:Glycoside hydrolase family 5 protein n=1 Tax=Austropuccinia psidii MF-1 TaxID=1389203 RepID=A0A9Q3ENT8_9BASI|nr:hypothetical protein [Austropuccinia psidii MF-1]